MDPITQIVGCIHNRELVNLQLSSNYTLGDREAGAGAGGGGVKTVWGAEVSNGGSYSICISLMLNNYKTKDMLNALFTT